NPNSAKLRLTLFGFYVLTRMATAIETKPSKGFKNTKWRSHFVFWYYAFGGILRISE
ncbi:MAG: hypothetical protein RLZZ139_15, partial [Cyanobacteriota bacterium]